MHELAHGTLQVVGELLVISAVLVIAAAVAIVGWAMLDGTD